MAFILPTLVRARASRDRYRCVCVVPVLFVVELFTEFKQGAVLIVGGTAHVIHRVRSAHGVAEAVEMTILRAGTGHGTYLAEEDTMDLEGTDLGATIGLSGADVAMTVEADPRDCQTPIRVAEPTAYIWRFRRVQAPGSKARRRTFRFSPAPVRLTV